MGSDLDDGLAKFRAGDPQGAAACCRRVLDGDPRNSEARHLLGLALFQTGDLAEAVSQIRRSVLLEPANVAAWLNLGVGLKRLKRRDDAEAAFLEALNRDPSFAGAWFNLGNLYLESARPCEAESAYRRALDIDPDDGRPLQNLAVALRDMGRLEEAEALLRQIVAAQPADVGALNNLGNVLRERKRADAAIPLLEEAASRDPASADVAYNLGAGLAEEGRTGEADRAFGRAVVLRPAFVKARWAKALALPILYDSEDEIEDWRCRYAAGLAELDQGLRLDSPSEIAEALEAIRERTNFALPYQGRNDRQLQMQYGALVHRIAAAAFPRHAEPLAPRSRNGRLKVGFVSAHFRQHTVLKLFGGWLTGLDRDRFAVHGFTTGLLTDPVTENIRARLDGFHPATVETLAAAACDTLIYLDIGMDPRAQVLAALRLAPRQYVAWGHPETTGLPTLDGFLSSSGMEPEDGELHYTESLIRLPNLSISYPRPPAPPAELRKDGPPILLCGQSLFKLLPRFDALAVRLAREIGACRLEFIAHPSDAVTGKFRARIGAAFRAAGLDEDRIRIHPRLSPTDFLAVNRNADLGLDSLAWSGGNTTLEALACGLPVVTLPGDLMRGRHSKAILERAGRPDLIARDADQYVEIAARLAARPERLDTPASLFDDPEPVAALGDRLERG
ncbi:MAG: tetratricopeptide repeat protein [Magnetospirillum sp. WYHS-4]